MRPLRVPKHHSPETSESSRLGAESASVEVRLAGQQRRSPWSRGRVVGWCRVIKNGERIDTKHVGTGTAHSDPSDTLWLDGKQNRPA